MQATSDVYKSIVSAARAADRTYGVEVKLEIHSSDGSELVGSYGEDVLISCSTTGKLFPSPSVGAAVSREIDVKMLTPTETLPRMAMMKLYARISYGTDISEWLPKGIFYIDTRSTDKTTGILTLHGYDAMLKTEQLYCGDASGTWPRDMATVVAEICDSIGVDLDERTTISSEFVCQLDTTLTMRQYLSYIAVAHGGNWIITDAGKLRLIGLAEIPPETCYLITEQDDIILFGDTRILV